MIGETLRYEVRSGPANERYVCSVHRKLGDAIVSLASHKGARIVVRGSAEDLHAIGAHMTENGFRVEMVSGVYDAQIQET